MLIIMLYLGYIIDHRKESVCVFANGRICNGPSGATFESDRVKIIKVNSNITLDKLKEVIGQKLRLPPNQIVANLVYRYPTCMNPPQYQACNLEDDLDVKQMWQVIGRFSRQLTCEELYANICEVSCDGHIEQLSFDEHGGNMMPSSSNIVNIVPQEPMFTNYIENLQQFESTFDGDNNEQSHNLPHIDDILDEIEDEEEYDYCLNAGSRNDTDDNDNVIEETNVHNELGTAFLSQIHADSNSTPELNDLEDVPNNGDEETLYIGKEFNNVQTLRRAIKLYSVQVHHTFKVHYSCKKYEEYRCVNYGDNCNWRVRACKKENRNFWEITRYIRPHSVCLGGVFGPK